VKERRYEYSFDLLKLKRIQEKLAKRVIREGCPDIKYIAGVDIAYSNDKRVAFVAIPILKYPELELVDIILSTDEVRFPYIPGYLAFREAPAILKALSRVKTRIDLIMIDGHGIAHPRRIGIASHIGVIKDIPTIGVAKSLLVGKFEEPGYKRGSYSLLKDGDEVIGVTLRTRDGAKPVFVSIGHRVSLDSAITITLKSTKGYRIPEPTRIAHIEVGKLKSKFQN